MQTSYWKLQKNSENKEAMEQAAALIKAGEVVSPPDAPQPPHRCGDKNPGHLRRRRKQFMAWAQTD